MLSLSPALEIIVTYLWNLAIQTSDNAVQYYNVDKESNGLLGALENA